jgi:hypothetical protein
VNKSKKKSLQNQIYQAIDKIVDGMQELNEVNKEINILGNLSFDLKFRPKIKESNEMPEYK